MASGETTTSKDKRLGPQGRRQLRRLTNFLSITAIAGILMLILLWDMMVYTTPVGHTAVVWHRFNIDETRTSEGPLKEGVHVIWPWDKLYIYDTRLQSYDQVYEVVSEDGLHVEITMTFRWRAVKRNIVELNSNVGPNYLQTLLVPIVGSVAREIIAEYEAESLYSGERDDIQGEIYDRVVSHNFQNGIGQRQTFETTDNIVIMEDTLIKSVKLPKALQDAIEKKLEQKQLVKGYEFRVAREKLESDRKKIEAGGIAEFQRIISSEISESYLRWRGIEATLQLAQSPNAKVIVIGNSETGLPLILDTGSQDLAMPAANIPDASVLPEAKPMFSSSSKATGDGDVTVVRQELQGNDGRLETGDINGTELPTDQPVAVTGTVPKQ